MLRKVWEALTSRSEEDSEPEQRWEPHQESDVIGVYPRDATWGNSIRIDEYNETEGTARVHGWKEVPQNDLSDSELELVGTIPWRRVRDGDLFGYEFERGAVIVFELYSVDNQDDPMDMFFALAVVVGYIEGTLPSEDYGPD